MFHMHGDTHAIIMIYGGKNTPPFIARDILAVHNQHLKAKVALRRRAGMQEDSAVECSTEPSNINYIGSYIPSAWHLQRICSAKLQVLRKGRHGGQREKRSFAHPRSCAQKTTTLGAGERPICYLPGYGYSTWRSVKNTYDVLFNFNF